MKTSNAGQRGPQDARREALAIFLGAVLGRWWDASPTELRYRIRQAMVAEVRRTTDGGYDELVKRELLTMAGVALDAS